MDVQPSSEAESNELAHQLSLLKDIHRLLIHSNGLISAGDNNNNNDIINNDTKNENENHDQLLQSSTDLRVDLSGFSNNFEPLTDSHSHFHSRRRINPLKSQKPFSFFSPSASSSSPHPHSLRRRLNATMSSFPQKLHHHLRSRLTTFNKIPADLSKTPVNLPDPNQFSPSSPPTSSRLSAFSLSGHRRADKPIQSPTSSSSSSSSASSSSLSSSSPTEQKPSSALDLKIWVNPDESDSENESSPDQETNTALPASTPDDDDDDDQVPLSQLSRPVFKRQDSATPLFSNPSRPPSAQSGVISNLLTRCRSSSRSLRSLTKKAVPTVALPPLPHQPQSQSSPRVFGKAPPHNWSTLRPVASSPNLSRLAQQQSLPPPLPPPLPGSIFAPPPHTLSRPLPPLVAPTFPQSYYSSSTSVEAPLGSSLSSASPSKPSKLRNIQSSHSLRPDMTESEVYHRMKKRHQLDLLHQQSSHHYLPTASNAKTIPHSNMVEPGLYSLLSEPQKIALRQRSQFLTQNLKLQLDGFAWEMVQSNLLNQTRV